MSAADMAVKRPVADRQGQLPTRSASRRRCRASRELRPHRGLYMESCIHCGMCAESCHFYEVTHDPSHPIWKLEPFKQAYARAQAFRFSIARSISSAR
jgi:ferredoxin